MEENKIEWYDIKYHNKVSDIHAKFIFDQAEKQVKETSDAGNNIVTRSTTLLTLIAGLLIALFGYGFSQWFALSKQFDHIVYSTFLTCIYTGVYLFIIIVLLTYNLFGKDYAIIGSEPKSLFKDLFFDKNKADDIIIHFYVSEFVQYQQRIATNKEINNSRWKKYHLALIMIVIVPVIIFLIFVIINHLY